VSTNPNIDHADDYADDGDFRPRLDDILSGSDEDFNEEWERAEPAGEFGPLPPGPYRVFIADVGRAESKVNGTPSCKLTLEVVEPSEHVGRKCWIDLWITPNAISTTKRDCLKLGYPTLAKLFEAPPIGDVLSIKVALRTSRDGRQFNRVAEWKVVDRARRLGVVSSDADVKGEGKAEGDTPGASGPRKRKGGQGR
jgi:hypothetical protein